MHSQERELRDRLTLHLKGGHAFSPVDTLIDKLYFNQLGFVPDGLPYSFYQVFYHIWYAQMDILEYSRNDNYEAPAWPDDYWPAHHAPANEKEWQKLTLAYFNERDDLCELLQNTSQGLMDPLPQNPGHNLLRQAQLVIEHTAYHTGQLYVIYRLLSKNQKK